MPRTPHMQPHTPMRLGMLNILMVVIALSLAVLAVLTLATAQAGAKLSQRQAQTMYEHYAVESTAQAFVAEMDEWLAAFTERDVPADRLVGAVARILENTIAAREHMDESLRPDVSVEMSVLSRSELDEAFGRVVSTDATVGALDARFTGPTGHSLHSVLAIQADGTYTIVEWSSTKLWDENGQEDGLLRIIR